jgi:hypothetical protein
MKKNVIVLTSGITGSSVLAGFLARSGYWAGDATHKKEYDTYENVELIDLNLQICQQAGYRGNYTKIFTPDAIARIASMSETGDEDIYRRFVEKCDQHRPWVWKDPRLWLTIRFWKKHLNLEECRFILLTRDLMHAWVSVTLRRDIRSYGSFKQYELSVRDSIIDFLTTNKLPYLHVTYENLIARPQETIGEMNRSLGTNLTVDDLKGVYRGSLYKVPGSTGLDRLKAGLIYLKNYSERLDVTEKPS